MSSTLPSHAPSSDYPLDGKGGSGSAKTGKPTEKTSRNFVYYRLYTKFGAIESNHPVYSNDRFIGRMPSKSFAPPHTVASIKRHLCKFEGLSEPDKSHIFLSLSSPTSKEDSDRLALYAPSGPGLSEQDLIVLVVESEKRFMDVAQSENLPERPGDGDIRYVHYRVYSSESDGDQKSKTFFDESDVSLGRINTLFVAPPHTVGSLKACIAKFEGIVTLNDALYKDMELFEDMNSDAAMSDTDVLSFLADTYPGSNEYDPIALVDATDKDQESTQEPTFTKRARLTETHDYSKTNPSWLPVVAGEIVLTDGNLLSMRLHLTDGSVNQGYTAINSNGEKGFVFEGSLKFI